MQTGEESWTPGPQGPSPNFARFYRRPKQNDEKTAQEGRPIFEMAEYVEIRVPGDRSLAVDRQVRDQDKREYGRQYQAFLADQNQDEASGTLLSAWGGVRPERVEEYVHVRVRTVEQLAGMSDENLQKMGAGALKERARAKDYIELMKGNAPVAKLRAEIEQRDVKLQEMERLLREQSEAIALLQKSTSTKK